jgi:hypothetical protein
MRLGVRWLRFACFHLHRDLLLRISTYASHFYIRSQKCEFNRIMYVL